MSPKVSLAPLSSLRVSKHQIPAHSLVPNTSIQHKPLLIYHSAFEPSTAATPCTARIISTALPTKVLCISGGRAKLCFGGEDNDGRVEPVVEKGDVVIVPAESATGCWRTRVGGFEMVGSYPTGFSWDMCYGKKGEENKVKGIEKLAWFGQGSHLR
ncbi:cupin domain-containing protein [Botryosphaeria dothidea]|uniref:Cupin domain-containing protein n=1 Tax=Botryosphaeria dothidea TaxID=55169 RepID=A0A8H4IRU7_9PEZI|nr:cupin domain-containing protein [Botryosphaeria dothidea]